jgi:hypothetical protein
MSRGIDIGARLTFDQLDSLRGYGVEVIGRYYFDGTDTNPKTLTRSEARYWLGQGGAILPIMEKTGSVFTYAQGLIDGNDAVADALRCGQPRGTPIMFASDTFVAPADYPKVLDYLNGAISNLHQFHPCWLYGDLNLLKFAAMNWPAVTGSMLWLAEGQTGAWDPRFSATQFAQLPFVGVTLDLFQVHSAAKLWRA